ncbi:MAG: hypothetical protein H6508_09110 [Calditrichaeota bacterium]|nr:hypothetical protein [Calditrichota bacterium]MCB9367325.1 hypothetical protein [Calditrichota bacterium]
MTTESNILLVAAATLGVTHTLLGPDHYVPFLALGRARGWNFKRTLLVTALCGIGHVLSSVVIGLAGLYLGTKVLTLEAIETLRGELAAWLLLGFGLAYMLWGLRHAYKSRYSHESRLGNSTGTWVLFIIFVLGPCEPLIPLLMFPASTVSAASLISVSATFMFFTVGTMVGSVAVTWSGLSFISVHSSKNYSHALAGGAIVSCAALMLLAGI